MNMLLLKFLKSNQTVKTSVTYMKIFISSTFMWKIQANKLMQLLKFRINLFFSNKFLSLLIIQQINMFAREEMERDLLQGTPGWINGMTLMQKIVYVSWFVTTNRSSYLSYHWPLLEHWRYGQYFILEGCDEPK